MTSIEALALSAILSLAKSPAVDVDAERPRLELLARQVATAASTADGAPFTGPARVEAAALALVAIAKHESEFRESVQDCRRRGDHGRAITMFQLYRSTGWPKQEAAELCSDGELAAHEGLRVFRTNGAESRTVRGLFDSYAGARGIASGDTCRIFERQAKRAGLKATCAGGREVGWLR